MNGNPIINYNNPEDVKGVIKGVKSALDSCFSEAGKLGGYKAGRLGSWEAWKLGSLDAGKS